MSTKPRTQSVSLTDEELVLLDCECRPDIQAKVDGALRRLAAREAHPELPGHIADMASDVVSHAAVSGKLVYRTLYMRHCGYCGKSQTYAKFKSGPRKGRDNEKKPIRVRGVDVSDSLIRIQNYATVGGCMECWKAAKPLVVTGLRDVEAELPEGITGHPPRFKRYRLKRCLKCGWEGHEGKMRQLPAMMQGTYPGGCPACPNESRPFGGTVFDHVKGFAVVSLSPQPEQSGGGE